jgi:release factor glutamine methyltransferase
MEQPALALPRSVGEALSEARLRLQAADVPEPGLEASLLLAHVLGTTRAALYAEPRAALTRAHAATYLALVQRRCHREPAAYITGSKLWWDLDLYVDRKVLIPRPETEMLAELAIASCRGLGTARPVVVDVGTGSGALAIAVARGVPSAAVHALDNAEGALRVARRNAATYAPGRIDLRASDLAAALPEPAQVIVANLPYIPTAQIAQLAPELAYEPIWALDGGEDGLRPIAALLQQIARWPVAPSTILLECGHDQAGAVRQAALACWPFASAGVRRDLAGIDRVVVIQPGT